MNKRHKLLKTSNVNVYMTPTLYAKIRERAQTLGQNVSAYLRFLAEQDIAQAKAKIQ